MSGEDAHLGPKQESDSTAATQAVEAKIVTGPDPVIVTANGARLPVAPINGAVELNKHRDILEERAPYSRKLKYETREARDPAIHERRPNDFNSLKRSKRRDASTREALSPSQTNPLFLLLPMYKAPTFLRYMEFFSFRASSASLSR